MRQLTFLPDNLEITENRNRDPESQLVIRILPEKTEITPLKISLIACGFSRDLRRGA